MSVFGHYSNGQPVCIPGLQFLKPLERVRVPAHRPIVHDMIHNQNRFLTLEVGQTELSPARDVVDEILRIQIARARVPGFLGLHRRKRNTQSEQEYRRIDPFANTHLQFQLNLVPSIPLSIAQIGPRRVPLPH